MPSRAEPLRSALTRAQRTRWATPASAIALGLVAFAVEAARGDAGDERASQLQLKALAATGPSPS
jgi:hypothetical protein